MTHALNLIRFTLAASALAFAFAFNLAAMYAQVVYVFLPGSRAQGQPAAQWGWAEGSGILHTVGHSPALFLGLCVAMVVVCTIVVRRSPK